MFFLLSPSKSQNFLADVPQGISAFVKPLEFINESEKLVSVYKKFSTEDLQKIFSVSENIASLNVERFQKWIKNPINQKPALLAFTGTVYNNFETEKYSPSQCEYADTNIKIISGLYGLISPFSLIQPYRLEMGIRQSFEIEGKKYKNLYDFWGELLTEKIISDFENTKNTADEKIIINVASVEYFKVLNRKKLKNHNIRIIDVDFKVWKKDKKSGKKVLKTIAIYAKKQRGKIMNWCIQNEISSVEELKKYKKDGYVFSEKYSKKGSVCFVCQN